MPLLLSGEKEAEDVSGPGGRRKSLKRLETAKEIQGKPSHGGTGADTIERCQHCGGPRGARVRGLYLGEAGMLLYYLREYMYKSIDARACYLRPQQFWPFARIVTCPARDRLRNKLYPFA